MVFKTFSYPLAHSFNSLMFRSSEIGFENPHFTEEETKVLRQ